MRQLLSVLTHWFPDRQFVFAGDGGYGTHALARFAARHRRHLTLVSLFYANAALHEPPPVVVGKKNGRPRKKGDKRPTPEAVVAATDRADSGSRCPGTAAAVATVEVVSGTGHWHKSGEGLVEVLWVFVHDLTGTHRDSYLFSTDPAMPVARVIETYTGRWNIETTFQEMRAYLGLETTRGRTKNTVLRAAPCLFGLYSVVALLYAELPAETTAEGTVSYRGKAAVTFSDAISAVRRQLWLEGVFESHGQTEAFRNLPRPLQAVLAGRLGARGVSRGSPRSQPEEPPLKGAGTSQTFSPCGTIGSDRSRTPAASKMALPIAGAMATIGVSPAPADGRSLRSSRTTSISGVSRNRGTRYFENRAFRILPILELDGLEERTAQSHDHRAFDLVLEMVRIDDRAALEGADGADDLHAAAGAVDRDLGAGGDVAPFLGPARDADAVIGAGLAAPAERARRRPRGRRAAARP